jgi:hypothetical protein
MAWNPFGSVLAIYGTNASLLKQSSSMVKFYSYHGECVKNLALPTTSLSSACWDYQSQRLALSSECHIFVASVRIPQLWQFYGNRILSYYPIRPVKDGSLLYFMHMQTGEKGIRKVPRLSCMTGYGGKTVLLLRTAQEKHEVQLCDAHGAVIESRTIDYKPLKVIMNAKFIIFCTPSTLSYWKYDNDRSGADVSRALQGKR